MLAHKCPRIRPSEILFVDGSAILPPLRARSSTIRVCGRTRTLIQFAHVSPSLVIGPVVRSAQNRSESVRITMRPSSAIGPQRWSKFRLHIPDCYAPGGFSPRLPTAIPSWNTRRVREVASVQQGWGSGFASVESLTTLRTPPACLWSYLTLFPGPGQLLGSIDRVGFGVALRLSRLLA